MDNWTLEDLKTVVTNFEKECARKAAQPSEPVPVMPANPEAVPTVPLAESLVPIEVSQKPRKQSSLFEGSSESQVASAVKYVPSDGASVSVPVPAPAAPELHPAPAAAEIPHPKPKKISENIVVAPVIPVDVTVPFKKVHVVEEKKIDPPAPAPAPVPAAAAQVEATASFTKPSAVVAEVKKEPAAAHPTAVPAPVPAQTQPSPAAPSAKKEEPKPKSHGAPAFPSLAVDHKAKLQPKPVSAIVPAQVPQKQPAKAAEEEKKKSMSHPPEKHEDGEVVAKTVPFGKKEQPEEDKKATAVPAPAQSHIEYTVWDRELYKRIGGAGDALGERTALDVCGGAEGDPDQGPPLK